MTEKRDTLPVIHTTPLLDAVRELPKAAKYLHVPVQSGCDEVLKRMKRLYTVGSYWEMLHRCREKVPGVAISSNDVISLSGKGGIIVQIDGKKIVSRVRLGRGVSKRRNVARIYPINNIAPF